MGDEEPRAGEPRRFEPKTKMRDAIAQNPDLPVVLMQFHIGGCSLCGFEEDDSIEKVAADNGVPLERLLAALNGTGES